MKLSLTRTESRLIATYRPTQQIFRGHRRRVPHLRVGNYRRTGVIWGVLSIFALFYAWDMECRVDERVYNGDILLAHLENRHEATR